MSKSKMDRAFRAQLVTKPARRMTDKEFRAGRDAEAAGREFRAHLEAIQADAIKRQWFYYGWQACERSRKP